MRAELTAYVERLAHHLPAGNTFACQQALKRLLEQLDDNLQVSAHFDQPGVPDLIIYREGIATGHIYTGSDSDDEAQTALPNVLRTDYLAFHHSGQTARLGTIANGQLTPEHQTEPVMKLLARFASARPPVTRTADELAQRLGELAALLRVGLAACLSDDAPDATLIAHWQVWEQSAGWSRDQLADEYAQAIAFSLISARVRHSGPTRQGVFTRRDVGWDLPPTNPFMGNLLQQIEDDRVLWRIDALVALLALADVAAIRAEIGRRVRLQDPLARLHQTFMSHYASGFPVTQPPESLAAYLVEGAHHLLGKHFKIALGLADDQAQLFDPAVGDGVTLFFAIQRISGVLRQEQQLDGAWDAYVADGLLPRLYGLNRSLAAYALAHLKIGLQLDTIGYHFGSDQRLQVYLDGESIEVAEGSPARIVVNEMRPDLPANRPLMVILSAGKDGAAHLPTAQRAIEATQGGIAALTLPPDFADGERYAGLRQDLLNFYSDLYVLQLPETTIGLFVRRTTWQAGVAGRIRYATTPDLNWLATHTITSTPWLEIHPQKPDYRFLPAADHLLHHIQVADPTWRLAEMMPENAPGLSEANLHPMASMNDWPVLYRPFDARSIASAPRINTLRHMLRGGNLALCVSGSNVFCASAIPHENALGPQTLFFPLYIYPDTARLVSDSPFAPGAGGRRPNFDTRFILQLANRLDLTFVPDGRGDLRETFGPEDIFNCVYAMLSADRNADRPLLLPDSSRQFRYLARRGRDLARYHRLYRAHKWSLTTGFHGSGINRVEPGYPRYLELAGEPGGRVYISKEKFFGGVERRQWEARTGGVHVLREWLLNREGYVLGWPDLLHYQRVIVALARSAGTLDKISQRLLDE